MLAIDGGGGCNWLFRFFHGRSKFGHDEIAEIVAEARGTYILQSSQLSISNSPLRRILLSILQEIPYPIEGAER
jgi:hypothetical protein